MMGRFLILISGISTSGKTSLAKMFMRGAFVNDIFVIPHTTTRIKRVDDDNRLIRCLTKTEYNDQKLISDFDGNGTLFADYRAFLMSNKKFAIINISFPEVITFNRSVLAKENVEIFHIMLRINNKLPDEIHSITVRYPFFFGNADLIERQFDAIEASKKFSFNEEFINQNVDLVLSQENGTLDKWCYLISESGLGLKTNEKEESLCLLGLEIVKDVTGLRLKE